MSGAEGPLKIAVAGGSIGGLCAGLTLRGAGFDVQVYEHVPGPAGIRNPSQKPTYAVQQKFLTMFQHPLS